MITEVTIGRVKYFPEQLPDSAVPTIAASSEASPIILDLRQFPPLLVRLSEVAVDRDDVVNEVEMRFKVDNTTLNVLAGSMFDGLQNNFSLLARSRIFYNLFNKGAASKDDFKTFFSLWVIKPTVAHKLRLGIPLTPEEQKLNRDLGISDTVEKGLLPLPLPLQLQREYQVLQEETHGFQVTVPTVGVVVATLHPANGQFLVLTKISADPGDLAANNIRVTIDRDHVSDYVEFPTWALGIDAATALGKEISCFIPALTELRIKLKATAEKVINIRFTVRKCASTNILRARWGLASKDELPGDVYDKVMAGVL
ncbi:unnamed protein product [marine sediment metagenome]|uniref:Uncharacterized protein n=1 Tax=marine sediment metagenome TaxID=412755 RepID=X1S6U8_9ZZZZ